MALFMIPLLLAVGIGAGAVILGALVGAVVGKYRVKAAQGQRRRLLTTKERVLYSLCVAVGISCILFGLMYNAPAEVDYPQGDIVLEEDVLTESDGGVIVGGEAVVVGRI